MNRKTLKKSHSRIGLVLGGNKTNVASCAITVSVASEIQLFPSGEFRASDGRPKDAPHWFLDEELAAAVIADFNARKNRTVIDYEHQTLLAAQNGQPAPAAGWFEKLEWRESGLFAIDVEWTDRAAQMIEGGEYKYISPVFTYDRDSGAITGVLNAALTNNPALDGMDAVAATQFSKLIKEEIDMELLEQLRWMLNLAVTATEEEVVAELQKAIGQIKKLSGDVPASAGFDVVALIKSQSEQIASLKAAASAPDPTKFVSVSAMRAVQDELSELKAKTLEQEVDLVIKEALAASKLLPAQAEWAKSHGMKDLASLKKFIDVQPPVVALTATQTGGNPPIIVAGVDTSDARAIADAAIKYQGEQAALGKQIGAAEAVRVVTKMPSSN